MLFINKLKKMKKVIYTANLGKYDKIRPIRKEDGWNYIYFIDWEISEEEKNNNTNWTFVMIPDYVKNMSISKAKKQRYIKINPHLFLKDYELSIYIDSTMTLFGDINDLIIRILPYNINIIVLEHHNRKSINEELKAVITYRKEKISMTRIIRERYNEENFEDNNGLIESNVIIRRHNEKDCINTMEKWWIEIINYSHRDQLSFNYILWKEHKKVKYIPRYLIRKILEQGPHK